MPDGKDLELGVTVTECSRCNDRKMLEAAWAFISAVREETKDGEAGQLTSDWEYGWGVTFNSFAILLGRPPLFDANGRDIDENGKVRGE